MTLHRLAVAAIVVVIDVLLYNATEAIKKRTRGYLVLAAIVAGIAWVAFVFNMAAYAIQDWWR